MKKISYKLTITAILLLAIISCRRDNINSRGYSKNEPTAVNIITKAALYDTDPDSKITSVRIIAFDRTVPKMVRSNKYYPEAALQDIITHNMYTGNYDFIIIANEPAGDVHTSLEGIVTWNNFAAINIPQALINSDNDIPMMLYQPDVTVLPEGGGVTIGGVTYPTWNVALKRLAVRFDMVLKSDIDLEQDFKGIVFSNIPNYVPLTGDYVGGHTSTRSIMANLPENAKYFRDTTIVGVTWAKVVSRIIMPTNMFNPSTLVARALKFSISLGDGTYNPSGVLALDESGQNYTLPPNYRFAVNGTVGSPIEINVTPADWGLVSVPGEISQQMLNISNTKAVINDRNQERIYFWTNQNDVKIDPTGYTGTTGTITFTVNSIFDQLSGTGAKNLHLDPSTGIGYVDIAWNMGSYVPNPNTTTSYRIFLNAGGLRRQINITLTMLPSPNEWKILQFTGTFHRSDQVGERLIYVYHDKTWSATVEAGDYFILLSTSRSFDPNIGTTAMGDAESYPILDGVNTSVNGVGNIYFRVGMASKNLGTAPRYGRIRLDYYTFDTPSIQKSAYMYVRQGEMPDAVIGTAKWTTSSLSDPLRGLGGINLTDHNLFTTAQGAIGDKTFTDFPSQVGYFFKWNLYDGVDANNKRAINPRNPSGTTAITGMVNTSASSWNSANDPCPTGYRHPTSAEFTALAPSNTLTTSLSGYYADGFLDRGPNANGTVTGINSYEYGSIGRLFYNPDTNASLFFPLTGGYRSYTGALPSNSTIAGSGTYCTSGSIGTNAYTFNITNGSITASSTTYLKSSYFVVRCVQQ